MSNFELIAGILHKGLSIWEHKDKTKYLDQLIKLTKVYYAEIDKPSWEDRHYYPNYKAKDFRDNNVIDGAFRELQQLGQTYIAASGGGQGLRNLIQA